MALSQRLTAAPSQSLIMTPQLQQAIKLLQYSQAELAAFVRQEIERNPLLELEPRDDDHAVPRSEDAAPSKAARDATDDVAARIWDVAATAGARRPDRPAGLPGRGLDASVPPRSWRDRVQIGGSGAASAAGPAAAGSTGGVTPDADRMSMLADPAAGTVSLRDHLIEQINIDIADSADRLIAGRLLDHLDDAGYLQADLDRLADSLGCGRRQVEQVLFRLQGFDPPGLFAGSLAECLSLQMADRDRLDPAMRALLGNLPLLADNDMAALMRVCGVDQDRLDEMIAELRSLDPKPALAFDHEIVQTVQPDLVLRRATDGTWRVDLNPDILPRPIINQDYFTEVIDRASSKADRRYLKDQLRSAHWLVKALHQRTTTILKVATEIVRVQNAFFEIGIQELKPLVLRDVARAIEMHESTVSRATANKYIATPRGMFELKFFFNSALGSRDGPEQHSSAAVRHRIRTLVENETPSDILSDDKIVALLQADGVVIARRTVAKYRNAMRIPSSVQRRRLARHAAR